MAIPFPFAAPLERASAGRYNGARGGSSLEGPKPSRCVTLTAAKLRGRAPFSFAPFLKDACYLSRDAQETKKRTPQRDALFVYAKAPIPSWVDSSKSYVNAWHERIGACCQTLPCINKYSTVDPISYITRILRPRQRHPPSPPNLHRPHPSGTKRALHNTGGTTQGTVLCVKTIEPCGCGCYNPH